MPPPAPRSAPPSPVVLSSVDRDDVEEGAAMDVTTFGQPGFDLSPRDDFLSSGLPASFKVGLAVELL